MLLLFGAVATSAPDDPPRQGYYDMLVSRCDAASLSAQAWSFSNGPEWAGSTGSLTAASDHAPALTLSYNFSGQPTPTRGYVAAEFFHGAGALAAVPSPTALSISVAGPAASIMVRVVDAQGQSHLGDVRHNATGGRALSLKLLGVLWAP